jgi:hypothetical protein
MTQADPKPEKRERGAGFYTLVVLVLALLYIVSYGPVWALTWKMEWDAHAESIETFYAPVVWLAKKTDTEPWLQWWVSNCSAWLHWLF